MHYADASIQSAYISQLSTKNNESTIQEKTSNGKSTKKKILPTLNLMQKSKMFDVIDATRSARNTDISKNIFTKRFNS